MDIKEKQRRIKYLEKVLEQHYGGLKKEMFDDLGCSRQMLWRWLNGSSDISDSTMALVQIKTGI